MALIDIVRTGVALADSITFKGGLQATVTHRVWQSQTVAGSADFFNYTRRALVINKQRQVKSPQGTMVISVATVIFLDPAVTVTPKDLVKLAGDPTDFKGHAVINTDAFTPESGPVLTQVYLA